MVTVRPARPDDAPAIRRVARAAWHAAYDDLLGADTVDERVDEWYEIDALEEAVNARGSFSVADDGGDIVGFAHLAPPRSNPPRYFDGERIVVLYRLYVHPDRWGEGLGSRLLAASKRRIDDSFDRIRLVVYAENDIGRSFYESRGFEQVAELDTSPREVILQQHLRGYS
ncbi:MAG: ribosomal protein S18 acetylase RimI-like enzyme [Natronomonas sp.]|jgi:ribosomal protein S18 acetylase RimI-like enzyme